MRGADLPAVVQAALDSASDQPAKCPFCANQVYAGTLQSAPIKPPGLGNEAPRPGLFFASQGRPNPHNDWFGKHFLAKILGSKSWFLPGAHIKARSCGKCRRLFLWGMADRILSETYGRGYCGLIAGAKFEPIEKAGHFR